MSTSADYLSELRKRLNYLKVDELCSELRAVGLSTKGKKVQLIDRLKTFLKAWSDQPSFTPFPPVDIKTPHFEIEEPEDDRQSHHSRTSRETSLQERAAAAQAELEVLDLELAVAQRKAALKQACAPIPAPRSFNRTPVPMSRSPSSLTEPQTTSTLQNDVIDLIRTVKHSFDLNRLPVAEPTVFSGDVLQYRKWKSSFNTLIEDRNLPTSERMILLGRYLSGEALEYVDCYLMCPSEETYVQARKALDSRYDNPFLISQAFKNKLRSWNKIQSKDTHSLRKFSAFLKQCCTVMHKIEQLSVLDTSDEINNQTSDEFARLPDQQMG
jgi:hypothetical protein